MASTPEDRSGLLEQIVKRFTSRKAATRWRRGRESPLRASCQACCSPRKRAGSGPIFTARCYEGSVWRCPGCFYRTVSSAAAFGRDALRASPSSAGPPEHIRGGVLRFYNGTTAFVVFHGHRSQVGRSKRATLLSARLHFYGLFIAVFRMYAYGRLIFYEGSLGARVTRSTRASRLLCLLGSFARTRRARRSLFASPN